MKDQHTLIKGYRDLTAEEITLMNEVKTQGVLLEELINKLGATPNIDQRWVSIAKTDLQKGIMAAVRSVARPESF